MENYWKSKQRVGKLRIKISKIIKEVYGFYYPPEQIVQANCTMNNRYTDFDTQYYWVAWPDKSTPNKLIYGQRTMKEICDAYDNGKKIIIHVDLLDIEEDCKRKMFKFKLVSV